LPAPKSHHHATEGTSAAARAVEEFVGERGEGEPGRKKGKNSVPYNQRRRVQWRSSWVREHGGLVERRGSREAGASVRNSQKSVS